LRLTRVGSFCYIGNFYVGTLAYAADMVLIAASVSAMRKMLAICDSFSTEYCVSLNAKKSKCLVVFPASKRCLYAHLSERVWQTNSAWFFLRYWRYINHLLTYLLTYLLNYLLTYILLGHIINVRMNDADDMSQTRYFYRTSEQCFSTLNSFTKYRLFRPYCNGFMAVTSV